MGRKKKGEETNVTVTVGKREVRWKIDGIFKADAAKVAEEIGEGRFTPREVLEKARDESTELHKCFEWDDGIAAEKYRLGQAECLIRMLYIPSPKPGVSEIRKYSITTERNTYQPTRLFLEQEDEYAALLKRAKAELAEFRKKYRTLSELQEVFEAIDAL